MLAPMRRFALLLVALAAVCIQIHQAQNILIRCSCPQTVKMTKLNVTDFEVLERRSGCDKTELIVTVTVAENSTQRLCLDPAGRMAMAYFKCWENKNKNETRKHECLFRKKRIEK
uniref:Chemokine interleukin-8-like domain-containing protein n=1 Tax=Neogobius melanostomus TaxID=47308 RepID=A0A8C6TPZ4_9GOBI